MNRPFAVYDNPNSRHRTAVPFIVVLQSPWLQAVSTVVVAPLRRFEFSEHVEGLQIPVTFDEHRFELPVLEISHLPIQRLKGRRGDLADYEFEIRRGLDRVFTGF